MAAQAAPVSRSARQVAQAAITPPCPLAASEPFVPSLRPAVPVLAALPWASSPPAGWPVPIGGVRAAGPARQQSEPFDLLHQQRPLLRYPTAPLDPEAQGDGQPPPQPPPPPEPRGLPAVPPRGDPPRWRRPHQRGGRPLVKLCSAKPPTGGVASIAAPRWAKRGCQRARANRPRRPRPLEDPPGVSHTRPAAPCPRRTDARPHRAPQRGTARAPASVA